MAEPGTPGGAGDAETPPETTQRPDEAHRRPAGLDDATVEALGKLSEALETVEHARGLLYGFHQTTGRADILLADAVEKLRAAGADAVADRIGTELLGRNVVAGRWTFQVVEDYDDGYWSLFRELEKHARDELAGGRRHLFEAEMKESERTHGLPGHEARPAPEG